MQQENGTKHTHNFKTEYLTQESKVFERPGQSPDLNLMLQWDLKNAEHERMLKNLSRVLLETGTADLYDIIMMVSASSFNLSISFFSNGSGETAVFRQVEQVQLTRSEMPRKKA